MFEAGSAWFTLGARVLSEGFDRYGQLVATAKREKEHQVALGARTQSEGFTKFNTELSRVRQNIEQFAVKAKAAWGEVSASTDKAATTSDQALGRLRTSLTKTTETYGRVKEAVSSTMRTTVTDNERMAKSAEERAVAERAAADETIRSNEKMVASTRAAVAGGGGGRNYVNPVGVGGSGGDPAQQSIAQAKKATAAWKEGFNALANFGKWATLGILAVGGVAVKSAADFQRHMELIHTQAAASQKEVDGLKNAVLALGPAVGFGPTQLADGLYRVESHGIRGSQAIDTLKIAAEGAKIGMSGLEETTTALVGVMQSAPKDISGAVGSLEQARNVMSTLIDIVGRGNLRMKDLVAALGSGIVPAAAAVGLGLKDVGAALDVMTSRAIPAQEGATRLRTVLGLIANPTNKAQKALDELGFSHDRLALDFRKGGLVLGLTDLQHALDNTFGRKLTTAEESKALLDYAQRLKDAGTSGNAAATAMRLFKEQLDKNGEGAIHSSQLIAEAFGGARMGTTMQILMQNVDDVRKHFDQLNAGDPAKRFQDSWAATQKTFSQQTAELWASIQVLGVRLGTWLIPKVEDAVKAFIKFGHYLGQHKELATALAIAFGTLLVAAISAFFARLIGRTAEGIKSIGAFVGSVGKIPGAFEKAGATASEKLAQWREQITQTTAALDEMDAAAAGAGETMASAEGGSRSLAGGGAAGALGPLEGMINGIMGTVAPGSEKNPICVTVVGAPAAVSGKKAAAEMEEGVAAGGKQAAEEIAAGEAAGGARAAEEIAAAETLGGAAAGGGASVLSRVSGAARTGAGAVLGGASRVVSIGSQALSRIIPAGFGVLIAQQVGDAIHGGLGRAVKDIGTGAAIGSMFGPWGTALGAALGGALALFTSHGKSDGQKWAENFTSSLPGHISKATQKGLQDAANKPVPAQPGGGLGGGGRQPDIGGVSLSDAALQRARTAEFLNPNAQNAMSVTQLTKIYDAQFNKQFNAMFKAAYNAGTQVGNAWIEGTKSVKFPTEFALTGSMLKSLSDVPKNVAKAGGEAVQVWRDSAAKQMLQYATTLEDKGKLPRGSVDRMIANIERKFPGLTAYLDRSGNAAEKAIDKHMKFATAQKNLSDALDNFRQMWDFTWQFGKTTNKNIYENTGKAMADLRLLMHDRNKKIREEATAEYQALQRNVKNSFSKMVDNIGASATSMRDLVISGSEAAYVQGSKNWTDFTKNVARAVAAQVLSVKEGQKIIDDGLNKQLSAFGEKPLSIAQIQGLGPAITAAVASGRVSSGAAASPHQTGGLLPGKEFGYQDNMVLVDPLGRPRAKMAGDEAIFNRHQQPYVDMGLRAIGFSGMDDLWNKVNLPHGYQRGGALPGFQSGGKPGGPGGSNYIYPLSGFSIGRTDMGVDASAAPGTPIGPIGRAKIGGFIQNWFRGQPYVNWQLLDGPAAGRWVYVAEQIVPRVHPGQIVGPNDAVATFAGSGTGIEMGWSSSGPGANALAASHYHEGDVTAEGVSFRNFISGLAHGKISGLGGFIGGTLPQWVDLKRVMVQGRGSMAAIAQGVLDKVVKAANRFGQAHSGGGGGSAIQVGGPVEKQIAAALQSVGFNKIATAGIMGNIYQESSFNPNDPGGGLFQFTPRKPGDNGPVAEQINLMMNSGGSSILGGMNAQSSPAAAATYFMNNFERPAAWAANLPRRISAAQSAYAQGYARGGLLTPPPRRRRGTPKQFSHYDAHPSSAQTQGNFMGLAHRLWGRLGSSHAIPTWAHFPAFSFDGSRSQLPSTSSTSLAPADQTINFPLWAASSALSPRDEDHHWALGAIVHEMAHTMQSKKLAYPTLTEGGAQAWSDHWTPKAARGWAYDPSGDTTYAGYVAAARHMGLDWLLNGQFAPYDQQYAAGGKLPGFASGGRTVRLPGGKFITVRNGKLSSGTSKPRQVRRTRTPITPTTASVLERLGLSNFVTDQNSLGQIDNQYSMQESLYQTFDGGQAGLPLADLDTLMGLREKQWDILFSEWRALPSAIAKLQTTYNRQVGHPVIPGHLVGSPQYPSSPVVAGLVGALTHRPAPHEHYVGRQGATGEALVQNEISSTESEISSLERAIKVDTRKAAASRHSISSEAMNLADTYARDTATVMDGLQAITDQRITLHGQALQLRHQIRNLPKPARASHGSQAANWDPAQLTALIMQGKMPSSSRSTGSSRATDPARRRLENQIDGIAFQALGLARSASSLHGLLRHTNEARQAAARRLRRSGFDAAWAIQQDKWRLQDRVDNLKAKLKVLKDKLKAEQAITNPEQSALTQMNSWLTGGLQGDQSILQSLGQTGMNILELYQQGADLPTPGRKSPTLAAVTKLLSDPVPKGLGLTIPAGLAGQQPGGQAGAVAEFAAFQQSRQDLFSQFGSNFVPYGANPFGGTAGLAAGVQYYGAAAGASSGTGLARGGLLWPLITSSTPSPGGTTVNIEQNFAAGPSDPHHYAAGLVHELGAMV